MALDDMICVGPVYVARWRGQYRCVWTPLERDGGFKMHGIGIADTPYIAIARAQAHAIEQGWKQS